MKVFLIIAGVIIIIGGLLLALAIPVVGILFAAFGIFLIWFGRKYQKKEKPVHPEVQEEPHYKEKTIKVAGITNYIDSVMNFAIENDEYEYTKSQIVKEELEDQEIPEYIFRDRPATFVYEPDNVYDSNAVAICIGNYKIGYVPKEHTGFIHDIIDSNRLISATCEFVGGNYRMYDSIDEIFIEKELNIGARVTVQYE